MSSGFHGRLQPRLAEELLEGDETKTELEEPEARAGTGFVATTSVYGIS